MNKEDIFGSEPTETIIDELSPFGHVTQTREHIITSKSLLNELNSTYRKLLNEVHNIITDNLLCKEVLREYERKEIKAKEAVESNDYSLFDDLADKYGISSEEYALLILSKATEFHAKEDKAIMKIGLLRSEIEKYISSDDLDSASVKIGELHNLNIADII